MMAGQIDESVSFSFQADSIHSGSVSFGRFAHEPLLWERRSSFSHNRIEEEVARCSKHRIVTEKKAYFEAQFKKKALLRQSSLDEQTGKQFGTGEKEDPDTRSHKDDTDVVQGNKNDANSESSVYIGYRDDFDYEQEAQVNVHFDESSDGSNYFDEAMEYHIEGREILISEPVKLPSSDSLVVNAKIDAGTVTAGETQTVIDCTYSRCSSAEHDVEVEKNIDACTCHAGSRKAEKEPDAVLIPGDVCPKIMVAIQPSGTESNGKVIRTQRASLCDAAKVSSSNLKRLKTPSVMETKTVKQSKISSSPAKKMSRSPNPEHLLTKSTRPLSRTMSGHNSAAEELRVAKVTKSPATTMIKDARNIHQTPNRTKRIIAPKDSGSVICTASLRSGTDVRADKRKEIHSTMAQTSHIPKTEINRRHVRNQEKTPDVIKQVRGGLNIKPKLTQSLLNKDETLTSKKKDATENRPQMNPSLPRTKVVVRSSINLKAEKGPPKSPSKATTISSCSAKKPTTTRTSVASSIVNKSTHPSSMRNAVQTKLMAGNNKESKLKNQTVPPKIEELTARGTSGSGVSQSAKEKIKRCTIRKVAEKPRLQDMCCTAARVR